MQSQPSFNSIKSHPLPGRFDDAKLGIFVHWRLFSVPAFAPVKKKVMSDEETGITAYNKWSHLPYAEWCKNSLRIQGNPVQEYHHKKHDADFHYEQFANIFNEEIKKWNPIPMAELFARTWARCAMLISKHHGGLLLWDSCTPSPRSRSWQASRDIPGELTQAVSAQDMKMGICYSSLLDWSFTKTPITACEEMIASSDTSRAYVEYVEKHWLELIECCAPWVLWSEIGYPTGYRLLKLWAHYYNHQPEGMINNRWMQLPKSAFNRLGRFVIRKNIDTVKPAAAPGPVHNDYAKPEYAIFNQIMLYHWETSRGIGNSFGYNQFEDANHYASADVISKKGSLLLKVGPCADGSIHPLQVEALEGLGSWLKVNGASIYVTHLWNRYPDADFGGAEVRYTTKDGALYVVVTRHPKKGKLSLPYKITGSRGMLHETGNRLRVERFAEDKSVVEIPAGVTFPVIKIQVY